MRWKKTTKKNEFDEYFVKKKQLIFGTSFSLPGCANAKWHLGPIRWPSKLVETISSVWGEDLGIKTVAFEHDWPSKMVQCLTVGGTQFSFVLL